LVVAVTLRLVTVKVALVAPAGTVRLAGTVAALVLLLARETRTPPAGAAALRVTRPWEVAPALTLVGVREREARDAAGGGGGGAAGPMVRGAVLVRPA
jgi:hypothetical protein